VVRKIIIRRQPWAALAKRRRKSSIIAKTNTAPYLSKEAVRLGGLFVV
jgi:hypothetical protein